jgi:hypothetical protein
LSIHGDKGKEFAANYACQFTKIGLANRLAMSLVSDLIPN